jgi:hypothetical protein
VEESRKLYDLVHEQGRDGAAGIVQGERGIARMEYLHETSGKEPPDADG